MRDAVDAVQHPAPGDLAAHDLDVLQYVGTSRPSAAYVRAVLDAGVGFEWIFETDPDRSQEGWNAGLLDVEFTRRRIAEVDSRVIPPITWYAVSDGNSHDPSTGGDRIHEYGAAVGTASRHPFGFYGNEYAVAHAVAGARSVGAEPISGPGGEGGWKPATWGASRLHDVMAQEPNVASPIPNTDFNTRYHDYGHAGPAPIAVPIGDDDMKIIHVTNDGAFVKAGNYRYAPPWTFEPVDDDFVAGLPTTFAGGFIDDGHIADRLWADVMEFHAAIAKADDNDPTKAHLLAEPAPVAPPAVEDVLSTASADQLAAEVTRRLEAAQSE